MKKTIIIIISLFITSGLFAQPPGIFGITLGMSEQDFLVQIQQSGKMVELAQQQPISFAKRYVGGFFQIFRLEWVILADFENGTLKKIWAIAQTTEGFNIFNTLIELTNMLTSKFGVPTKTEQIITPPYTKDNLLDAYLTKNAIIRHRWDTVEYSRNIKIDYINNKYRIGVEYSYMDFINRIIQDQKKIENQSF